MAGIIERTQQQPAASQEPAPQAGQPTNQQAVERVVIAATRILHDPKIKQQILQMMQQAGDPVQAMVEVVFLIMRQIMEKSGKSVPSDVLGAAAFQVLNLVGELAQAAGLFEVTPELIAQAAKAGIERLKQEVAAGPAQPAAVPQTAAAPAQPIASGV